MIDERYNAALYRFGGYAGLGAIILLLISLPLAPPWPQPGAGADAVVSYFAEHRAGFLRQVWFSTCGAMLLVPFAAAIAGLFRMRGRLLAGGAFFGAMLIFVSLFGLTWIPWVAIAFRPDRSRDLVLALYDFGLLGQFVGVAMPLALLFGAFAFGTRDGVVLPRWLGWLALVAVPVNLLLAACSDLTGILSPSGPVGFTSIGIFTLFVIAASLTMLRRAGRSAKVA